MKRKSKRLKPAAVDAFLTRMRQLAKEWGGDDFSLNLDDTMHLWAAEEVSERAREILDRVEGEKTQRKFRKWLRNEPARLVRLIDAARRRLAAERRAK